jgi:hypothetical protein
MKKKGKITFAKKMPHSSSHVALLQSSSCNLSLLRRTLGGERTSVSDQEFAASTDLSKVSAPASLDSTPYQPATAELRMPSREIGEMRELAKA